jgi:serine/threonine-protein kinase HipA
MTDYAKEVLLYGQPIGEFVVTGSLSVFRFSEAYRGNPRRAVLGQQFEEDRSKDWRQSVRIPVWFSNLLPEGPMREFLARELEESPRNESSFLFKLGSDLPGALSLGVNLLDRVVPDSSAVEPPEVPSTSLIRFSVAGVQLKLSMMNTENGLRLAGSGELGGSYVKFPGDLPGIPENEYSMMRLAGKCSIEIPECRLTKVSELGPLPKGFDRYRDHQAYVVERFDRQGDRRIHIEDFNQVVGQWPEKKYQGASYETLGRLIYNICGERDLQEYLRRVLFNIAVGNEDAHLKNWSLIYRDPRLARLSPAYDIVSTVGYEGLTRDTGLKIGKQSQAQKVDIHMFKRFAAKTGASEADSDLCLERFVEEYRNGVQEVENLDKCSTEFWASLDRYQQSLSLFGRGTLRAK